MKTIEDLPGEQWAPVEGHADWLISTMGRVVSTRRVNPKLLSPQINPNGELRVKDTAHGGYILVHRAVVAAFRPNDRGPIVFLDGDKLNPVLSNLVVDTKERRLARAITMAEQSSSEWAQDFARYWRGDRCALDRFYMAMRDYVVRAIYHKNTTWHCDYRLAVGEIAHATLVQLFFQICNAKIRSLDGLRSYAFAIARNIIAGQMRYAIPLSPALCQSEEVDDVTNIDQAGYAQPSAELMAIYHEAVASV